MATWVSHLRVADYFLNSLEVTEREFIVGNIGPDCGEPNKEWSQFTPPSNITHWTKTGNKSEIDSEAFYLKYLSEPEKLDRKHYSFYIGYYIHLLTDIEFTRLIGEPKIEKFKENFNQDKNFIWIMKKDWYDIDHLYLRDNPGFEAFDIFTRITEFPNEYLDYYSDTAIIRQIRYITNFYQNFSGDLDRVYPYLTKGEMDFFVEEAQKNIYKILQNKGIL